MPSTDRDWLTLLARDPQDLLLKAAYADWLEERGDVVAEIVRRLSRGELAPYVIGEEGSEMRRGKAYWRSEESVYRDEGRPCRLPSSLLYVARKSHDPPPHDACLSGPASPYSVREDGWVMYKSRAEAEIAAIRAYRLWKTCPALNAV